MSKWIAALLGLLLGGLVLIFPLSQWQPDSLDPLRSLAVQLDGRKQPLETVAQQTVAKLHGTSSYRLADGTQVDALGTFLALWFNLRSWNEEPIILVSYRPLKEQLGLDPDRTHFTFQELMGHQPLAAKVQQAHQKDQQDIPLSRDEREALTVEARLQLLYRSVGDRSLPIVPHPSDPKGAWVGLDQAQTYYDPEAIAPLLAQVARIQQTLLQGGLTHLPMMGPMAASLRQGLQQLSPGVYPADAVLAREVHFNHFHPFAKAWHLYALAFVAGLLSCWWLRPFLYWSALGLFTMGVGVQAYGFWLRTQIAGRPPVTNMYESVVWVGLGIAAIALILELSGRQRYPLLAAAPLSIVCLVLADSLPAVLDASIQPLVPVLRDNFWLSIHVPTITLSYASFALALGIGHVALGNYLLTPQAQGRIKALAQLNYRVLQVGVLLLTTGILLGGIWAHFSWGRFWGWDPKETWALIALLCYLVPLHGRLVGWIGNFGIQVASIVSFNAVLMAWYGVNFVLGTGLHSYGFATGGSAGMIASIVGLDLLLVLIAAGRYQGWGRRLRTPSPPSPLTTADSPTTGS